MVVFFDFGELFFVLVMIGIGWFRFYGVGCYDGKFGDVEIYY